MSATSPTQHTYTYPHMWSTSALRLHSQITKPISLSGAACVFIDTGLPTRGGPLCVCSQVEEGILIFVVIVIIVLVDAGATFLLGCVWPVALPLALDVLVAILVIIVIVVIILVTVIRILPVVFVGVLSLK